MGDLLVDMFLVCLLTLLLGVCFTLMVKGCKVMASWIIQKQILEKPKHIALTAYKTYVINFPDGVVTTTNYYANIPDYTTWSEPMVEMFLLLVKDWRNWERISEKRVGQSVLDLTITHKMTGVSFKGIRYVDELVGGNGLVHKRAAEHFWHPLLLDVELYEVISLAKIWKDLHYGYKLNRINNIKYIRKERIEQEQKSKRKELNKQVRSEQAQKIREYLKGVSK